MEQVNEICNIDKELKKTLSDIFKYSIAHLKSLKNTDNDLINELKYRTKIEDETKLKNILIKVINDALQEPQTINNELPNFFTFDKNGIKFNFDCCPYLTQVWNGDIYDKTDVESLILLNDDLVKQKENLKFENIINRSLNEINGIDKV